MTPVPFSGLHVSRFIVGPLATNAYVLWNDVSRRAAVVDPGAPDAGLSGFLDREGLEVEHVILTHGHFDHIAGVPAVLARGRAEVWIHAADAPMLTSPDLNLSAFAGVPFRAREADGLLEHGAEIETAGARLNVLHTPGHTAGGVCLAGEGFLLSGDTLFRESVGRTDFPGGSMDALLESIRRRLGPFADGTRVLPGHGDETNLGHERKHNPFLPGAAGRL